MNSNNTIESICDYDVLFKNYITLYSINVIRIDGFIEIDIQDSLCMSATDINNKPLNIKLEHLGISDIENILSLMTPDEETGEYRNILLGEYSWKYTISDEFNTPYTIIYKDNKQYATISNDNTVFMLKCLDIAYSDMVSTK